MFLAPILFPAALRLRTAPREPSPGFSVFGVRDVARFFKASVLFALALFRQQMFKCYCHEPFGLARHTACRASYQRPLWCRSNPYRRHRE